MNDGHLACWVYVFYACVFIGFLGRLSEFTLLYLNDVMSMTSP
jgi:hypothetical protein